ncbi:MAG TPA: hypothetical protein ENK99_07395, partial [Campylobacterales bacterium]|nr:hypothetical protein [Campylobacterales bacterium]
MKIKNSKSIFFLFIIITVMSIMFGLFYYVSISYSDYRDKNEAIEHIVLINKFDAVLSNIDEEKLCSAIYMGTKNKKELKKLKVYREFVDLEVEQLLGFLDKHREKSYYKESIKDIFKNLNYIRTRVDIINMDNRGTLFEYYTNKIDNKLIGLIQNMVQESLLGNSGRFYYYMKLSKLKENLNTEKAFISFILSGSIKMNSQDLLLWENFIKNDISPNFYKRLDNVVTIAKLTQIINPKIFPIMTDELRGKIFINSIDGRYSISLMNWIKQSVQKIQKVDSAKKLLIIELENNIKNELNSSKDITIKLTIATILIFILFITLVYLFRNNIINNRLLVDTLKD